MAVLFMGKPEKQNKEKSEELRRAVAELERKTPQASLTVVDGAGLGKGRMLILLHKDYTSYAKELERIRSLPHVEAEGLDSFLVDLNNERNFRILSMEQIAGHFQTLESS
jgi:hypothetical protein